MSEDLEPVVPEFPADKTLPTFVVTVKSTLLRDRNVRQFIEFIQYDPWYRGVAAQAKLLDKMDTDDTFSLWCIAVDSSHGFGPALTFDTSTGPAHFHLPWSEVVSFISLSNRSASRAIGFQSLHSRD